MNTTDAPVPTRALMGYGLAAAPAQFMYVLILIMYLKYAVDDLGASAAAIGTVFLVAKLWDAVSDPLVGSLSDRTVHPLGRRRLWLFLSAPLLCVFGVMAWAPPSGLEGAALVAWITVSVLGFYTAYTVFEVPHMALGAELTFHRQQRNLVFGIRQVVRTLGMFAAGTGGVYLVQQGASAAAWMAYGFALVTLLLVIGGVALVPGERSDFIGRGGDNPFRALRDIASNPHARLLLFVFFIESIGSGGIGVLTPFLVEYVVGDEGHGPCPARCLYALRPGRRSRLGASGSQFREAPALARRHAPERVRLRAALLGRRGRLALDGGLGRAGRDGRSLRQHPGSGPEGRGDRLRRVPHRRAQGRGLLRRLELRVEARGWTDGRPRRLLARVVGVRGERRRTDRAGEETR